MEQGLINFTEKVTAEQIDKQGDMMVEYKRKKLVGLYRNNF